MKKVITLVAAIMLLVTSSLALAGCGGTKTLEEYVNSDSDVQQELSDLESSFVYQDANGTELYSNTYQ